MRYQFGDFELTTERYERRRNGTVLRVEPLVFDLILFLLRHAGRVVSRDEIVEGVWQGRLVSETTIDGCIKLARRVLGDSGDNQSYIRTVRGRGFEFAAPVTARDQGQSVVGVSQDQIQKDLVGSQTLQGGGVVKNEAALAGHPPSGVGTPFGTAPRPALAVFPFAN